MNEALRPISQIISRRILRIFLISMMIQLLILTTVMAFLSYNDASRRANFLTKSNETSLGLMISTGDIFQLKNVMRSFRGETTPFAWILNEVDENILANIDSGAMEKPRIYPRIQGNNGSLLLVTSHDIVYNGTKVGRLILANRLMLTDWIVICLILLVTSVLTYYVQGKYLEVFSLSLGRHIVDLGNFFNVADSETHLNAFAASRRQSSIREVESLANQVHETIGELIRNANLKKEAAIGRITSQLSHDLRTPLHSIERLLHLPGHSTMASQHGKIRESLNRLNAMLESLRQTDLELLIEPNAHSFDLGSALTGIESLAEVRGIRLELPKSASPVVCHLDRLKFERALMNLVVNAVDAAHSWVRVEVAVSKEELIIRVVDNGPGVPAAILLSLFQRGITQGKAGGTGLGLAYVRQIMRGHGGDVNYLREQDLTIFECRLPHSTLHLEDSKMEKFSHAPAPGNTASHKIVAVCLTPASLTTGVQTVLESFGSPLCRFVPGYAGDADIVVTNDQELVFKALDDEKRIYQIPSWLNQEQILSRLTRKFNLT